MNLKASQVTSRIEGKFSAPVPGCADCGLSEHELPQLGGEAAPLAAAPHEAAVAGGGAGGGQLLGVHVAVDRHRDLDLHLLHLAVTVEGLHPDRHHLLASLPEVTVIM